MVKSQIKVVEGAILLEVLLVYILRAVVLAFPRFERACQNHDQ